MTFRSAVSALSSRETGLTDRSASFRAVRFQGPGTAAFLESEGLPCPSEVFSVHADTSLLVARVGRGDVIVQESVDGDAIRQLEAGLNEDASVFQVPEESATFLLSGRHADAVWRQTCGVNLAERPICVVVYTRVAGVSCAVIPEESGGERRYRIWVDYSYAPALWETLGEVLDGDRSA